jgi:DNA ligase 1
LLARPQLDGSGGIRLQDVVETSRRVRETGSRLDKVGHLAACLRRAEPVAIPALVALLSGEPRQGRIGLGPASVSGAAPRQAATAPVLTLFDVDAALDRIAGRGGPGASADRARLFGELLARATREEQDFLLRAVLGELRQGALEGLMIEAVAQAAELPSDEVRRALMVRGDLGAVARVALTSGRRGLAHLAIELFRPVKPMLAQTAKDTADALAQLGRAAFEDKLDGARIQVHKQGHDVRVFTRQLNDVTDAVPEVVEAVRNLAVRTLILDGEALAFRGDGTPQPFQVTMRRFGRKLEVARLRESIPLCPVFFDCMYLDDEVILDLPAEERFSALSEALPEALLIRRSVTGEPAAAEAFLREALARGHEGVMAKDLRAPYEAGARGRSWLKVKPAVTLDLVVLAAEWGHGRRRGWLSNLHLGARDPATGGFVMLGKTFKGMTDAMLTWQTDALQKLALSRDAYTVHVRPELVVEVAFNDIQVSPQYPGGLALRFARIKRYRPDKRPEEADTIETVRSIYAQRLKGRGEEPRVGN